LLLALNRLARDGKVVLEGELTTLSSFQTRLSGEEAAILRDIENLLKQEKYSSSSFDQLLKNSSSIPAV